jgi:hypothetical protein
VLYPKTTSAAFMIVSESVLPGSAFSRLRASILVDIDDQRVRSARTDARLDEETVQLQRLRGGQRLRGMRSIEVDTRSALPDPGIRRS